MIINNINVPKLHQELCDNQIYPNPVLDLGQGSGEFRFADGTNLQKVQLIIDAHDPTPIPRIDPDDVLNAKIEVQTINTLIDLGVI